MMGVLVECQVEGKDMILERDNHPIVTEREGTDGETVEVTEGDGGEDMKDRGVGVVEEAGRPLQGEVEDTRRMAMRLSVGDSMSEQGPGMTLGEENWDEENVLYVDRWDT